MRGTITGGSTREREQPSRRPVRGTPGDSARAREREQTRPRPYSTQKDNERPASGNKPLPRLASPPGTDPRVPRFPALDVSHSLLFAFPDRCRTQSCPVMQSSLWW